MTWWQAILVGLVPCVLAIARGWARRRRRTVKRPRRTFGKRRRIPRDRS